MKISYYKDEVKILNENINQKSALYFYRATPFTEHGEFNYNGSLKEDFFFENLFSYDGKCNEYTDLIKKKIQTREYKSILLKGNKGCGKSTFMHHLNNECQDFSNFVFFDFDKNTSHPTLGEYIEIFSNYLLDLLLENTDVNIRFYNLYLNNQRLICQKINANNNIRNFFDNFHSVFILDNGSNMRKSEFIKVINDLYFNQILSLVILWHICNLIEKGDPEYLVKPNIFCLDNLDVLVNKEIIEKFFKEYFRFVRNIDSIIQNLNIEYKISYNTFFTFIFCCRQHTWAMVRQYYHHSHDFIKISTLERNITNAFDKKKILLRRKEYIFSHQADYSFDFKKEVNDVNELLSDLDEGKHNIYDLFNDDYRQCNITFEELLEINPCLIKDYCDTVEKTNALNLGGARGIVYKALFEKFKIDGLFNQIGVLELDTTDPLVSNARMILSYLNFYTYSKRRKSDLQAVAFEKIVRDFDGIIKKENIEQSIIAMFKLGDDSSWNELVAFKEIHSDEIISCENTEIFITKAGHEYLDLIATHFEFFNIRVIKRGEADCALFSDESILKSKNPLFEYNFQELIDNVCTIVKGCCENMSTFYTTFMENRFSNINDYLRSHFVYGDTNVLHGERIIHTHIRYIDNYRIYVLNSFPEISDENKKRINKYLIEYITKYIKIGEANPNILTTMSTENLFPVFYDKIKIIVDSEYEDFTTKIDI